MLQDKLLCTLQRHTMLAIYDNRPIHATVIVLNCAPPVQQMQYAECASGRDSIACHFLLCPY